MHIDWLLHALHGIAKQLFASPMLSSCSAGGTWLESAMHVSIDSTLHLWLHAQCAQTGSLMHSISRVCIVLHFIPACLTGVFSEATLCHPFLCCPTPKPDGVRHVASFVPTGQYSNLLCMFHSPHMQLYYVQQHTSM